MKVVSPKSSSKIYIIFTVVSSIFSYVEQMDAINYIQKQKQ